jgi:hypothetical protein
LSNDPTRRILSVDTVNALEAVGLKVYAWPVKVGFRVEIDVEPAGDTFGMGNGTTPEKALLTAVVDLLCETKKGGRTLSALIGLLKDGGAS